MGKRGILPALVLALALVGTAAPSAAAAETGFSDVEGHYAQAAVETWSGCGVLKGYPDGTFQPDDTITRAELAAVLDRVMGYRATAENSFADLPGKAWYTDVLLRLAERGIFTGDEGGRMRPEAPITRQEAFAALARALELGESEKASGFADEETIAPWARGYIAAMREAGYIQGDKRGNIYADAPITRAEVVTVLDRMAAGFVHEDGAYSRDCKGSLFVNAGNVTLRDMTVEGDLIITDGVGEGEVRLDKVTVKGDVILRGCGENSFHILPGCRVKKVIVTKTTGGRIRLVNETGQTIPMVYINDGAGGVTLDGGELDSVVISCDAQVTIAARKVDTLSVVGNAQVTVESSARVARAELGKTAEKATLTVKGKVTALVNDAGAAVDNRGTIGPENTGGGSGGGSSSGGGGSSSGGEGGSGSEEPSETVLSEVTLQLLPPRFGEIPDTADVLGVGYTARTVWMNADGTPASYRWKEDGASPDTFTADQAYQAVITLTPISGYRLAEELRVKVTDGKDTPTGYTPAKVTADGKDRVVTMAYDKTEHREPVSGVSVVAPAAVNLGGTAELKVAYWNNLLTDPGTFAYQWYRCGDADGGGKTPIAGAVEKNYTIPAGDTGEKGELYYCCDMTILGKVYPSSVKAVEVLDALDPGAVPVPVIVGAPTVEENGRWMDLDIGGLISHKDVSYTVTVRVQIKKEDGADLGGSVDMADLDYTDIPEEGKVSWRLDLTDFVSGYIFTMMGARLSYDLELGEVSVTVSPELKGARLPDQVLQEAFDMTGKGVFHTFTPVDKISDELWQGPTRGLRLVVRSSGGTFVDRNDPNSDPVPVGKYERVTATFQKSADWVDGTMEGNRDSGWNGTLYIPNLWLDGFEKKESMAHVLCAFYACAPDGGMNVYGVELMSPDIELRLENE